MMDTWTQLQSLNARIQGYEVSTLTVFYDVQHCYEQEDTCALQSLMETVTLILPIESRTMDNPSNSKGNS